jgi:hypothetical protein
MNDKADQLKEARLAKRLKNIQVNDRVVFWKAGNRGGAKPLPADVIEVGAGAALVLFVKSVSGASIANGARHWKDQVFTDNPKLEATLSSWAFIEEIVTK